MKSMRFWMVGLVLAGLLLAGWQTVVAEEQQYDFRKTRWGMSMIEVKMAEKEAKERPKIIPEPDMLYYDTNILGYSAILSYEFHDNKLVDGSYYINKENFNELNQYYKTYKVIQRKISDRIGEPIKDKKVQRFKDQHILEDKYGQEIARRNLKFYSTWNAKNSQINLLLVAKNQEMILMLQNKKLNK